MFFDRLVTRSTLTEGPSSISYLVTEGPRLNPVTCASTWNCSSTSDSASTTMSLARVRALGAEPGRSSAIGGSVYATASPVSVSRSGLRRGMVGVEAERFDQAGLAVRAGAAARLRAVAALARPDQRRVVRLDVLAGLELVAALQGRA